MKAQPTQEKTYWLQTTVYWLLLMIIITVSIFICVTLGVMGLYWLVFRPQSAATERLKRMGETGGAGLSPSPATPTDDSPVGPLAGRMAGPQIGRASCRERV